MDISQNLATVTSSKEHWFFTIKLQHMLANRNANSKENTTSRCLEITANAFPFLFAGKVFLTE